MIRELICEKWPIAPYIPPVHKVYKKHHCHHYSHKIHKTHHICHHYHLRCHWVTVDEGGGGGAGSSSGFSSVSSGGMFTPLEMSPYYNSSISPIQFSEGGGFLIGGNSQTGGIHDNINYYKTIITNNYLNSCCLCPPVAIPELTTMIMLFLGFAIITGLATLKGKFK